MQAAYIHALGMPGTRCFNSFGLQDLCSFPQDSFMIVHSSNFGIVLSGAAKKLLKRSCMFSKRRPFQGNPFQAKAQKEAIKLTLHGATSRTVCWALLDPHRCSCYSAAFSKSTASCMRLQAVDALETSGSRLLSAEHELAACPFNLFMGWKQGQSQQHQTQQPRLPRRFFQLKPRCLQAPLTHFLFL